MGALRFLASTRRPLPLLSGPSSVVGIDEWARASEFQRLPTVPVEQGGTVNGIFRARAEGTELLRSQDITASRVIPAKGTGGEGPGLVEGRRARRLPGRSPSFCAGERGRLPSCKPPDRLGRQRASSSRTAREPCGRPSRSPELTREKRFVGLGAGPAGGASCGSPSLPDVRVRR